jgi:pyridoxal phosphate enzyme (YggS family)
MIAEIPNRLEQVRRRIAESAVRAGRAPESVRLIAVSKHHPAEAVRAAYAAGQRLFGENRPQELRDKRPLLPADCEWHLIGHLQGNKARLAVQAAAWIHSVNSAELLQRLNRIAGEEAKCPVVLLEVNVSGEASKSGASPDAARGLLEEALRSPHLDCRGLMTMAPYDAPEAELRRVFGGLRELRDRLAAEFGTPLPELSMGMSDDFGIAIEEGATLVRVGTAIFGGRDYGAKPL